VSAVYNIPAGLPFADVLAQGLLERYQAEPLQLAECLVLLPTRRACRTLKEAFLRQSDGKALLLPRMVPLGDLDAEELALTTGASIAPAISPRRRQLLLAQLVARFNDTWLPAQHLAYARQLGRLMDDIAIENADVAKLDDLASGTGISEHWGLTLNFLKPVLAAWPAILEAEGALDPVARRNLLLEAQAKAWRETPPQTPVIAAGMTGVIPAIATLLRAVLALPKGEIVLPGLPTSAAASSWWNKVDETHPHYGLRDLLAKLDLSLTQVALWPAVPQANTARHNLLHTVLLPAAATDSWAHLPALNADGITRVTCANEQEEATLIAYKLREVLEEDGRTGTLITPDRNLGRRVAQMLRRWGLGIDDSAGTPLAKTESATFLRVLLAYAEQPDGHNLLALLKHPLMLGGVEPHECRSRAREIERLKLRGHPRINGIPMLLRREPPHAEWLQQLDAQMAPLLRLTGQKKVKLPDLLRELVLAGEALSSKEKLWKAEPGEALARWVAELMESARDYPALETAELGDVLLTLMSDAMVRLRYGDHPRLTLLGPMESRLQSADVIILAGLNEGNWPAPPEPDPWMSRPMRKAFGLKSPEQRLGEEAHDFYTLSATPEVILCRAERQDGAPSVPARWLRRLDTLLEAQKVTGPYERGEELLAHARLLDHTDALTPTSRPAPCPPLEARPNELWVTDIEKLRQDPYSIYAKIILALKPLDEIEPEPSNAERGSFIHAVLHEFLKRHKEELPPDPLPELLAIGDQQLQAAGLENEKALWWPRFIRAMNWFIETERKVRNSGRPIATEAVGKATLPNGFVLHAKADRIDYRDNDKSLAVIDYKTGHVPTDKERQQNIAVQLPLEAFIAAEGGFAAKGVPALPPSELEFWKVSGANPPGLRSPAGKDVSAMLMMNEAVAALAELVEHYRNPETAYTSLPDPDLAPRYNDYEHLARVKEWAGSNGEDE